MTEEYILKRDVIHDHSERMENIKRYYPYFRLIENDFSQYQGGKYEMLDMGYILMAVLRFFIEENNFKEKDVTYEEYSSFIKEIYERDFGLRLEKAEEQSLSLYIFDKIRNEGKPFIYQYFDPEEKKKKSIRIRLIESRIKNEAVYYYLTGEAVEFYLETKEIKDESMINISQILLTKMISTKNFRGGIEVVRRINHQVIRLKMRYNEVLELLSHDVFAGIKAYEKFMENVVKWFGEEQRMFHKNMELINETLKRADQPGGEIYFLEMELKRALVNHSELLDACTRLQIQADEMISKAKFSKLKQSRFSTDSASPKDPPTTNITWLTPETPRLSIFSESSTESSIFPSIAKAQTHASSRICFNSRCPSFSFICASSALLAWSGVFSSATSIISSLQYRLRRFSNSSIAWR